MLRIKNKVVDSVVWVIFEFIMAVIYGIVLIFAGHAITGADAKNFYNFVPNLHTEVACYADSAHPLVHLPFWERASNKRGHWFAFLTFYTLQCVFGIAAYWIQRVWFYHSYPLLQNKPADISTLILFHQVCSFFICTSLESWTLDGWASKIGPISKSLILYGISWTMWFIGNNEIAEHTHYTKPSNFNHFHMVGGFATSIILTNLLWCNVFSVQKWDTYKPFVKLGDRFGHIGGIILLFSIAQWFICIGIAKQMFKSDFVGTYNTFMAHCEGAWTILCYFWYGMTIVGAHVSPHLWPSLEKSMKSKFALWLTYCVICLVLGAAFTVCLYLMYTRFLDPVFVEGVLKVPQDGHKFNKPGYLFAFGAANIPYTYQMCKASAEKHKAEHDEHVKKHHSDVEEGKVEVAIAGSTAENLVASQTQ
ncbi:Transmembrane_domain-containing protein [Hexamita inflata]|uniref:Transmembrane domain-containing protein n=1 Tax=Hexamita inflata TaxID=28002 RepID=A0AA86PTN6_9EUKA|nr:Transmembrane domain-containing protein [Hexamita inflata]